MPDIAETSSGTALSGLLVAADQHQILRSIVGPHAARPSWVAQCRLWEPVIAAPSPALTTGYTGPVQRRYWLTIPVDAGRSGRTAAGQSQRLWDSVAGRDTDSDHSVARYAAVARDIISALPDEFNITPATPEQIRWHRRHNVFRGAIHAPLPPSNLGPDTLCAADFERAAFDEGANAVRTTRWPTMRPVVRVYDPDHPDGPVSYQTMLTVDHFPASGLRFSRAAYLHALDNVATTATIDWTQNLNIRTPDLALALNHTNTKNLKDQDRQRGRRRRRGRRTDHQAHRHPDLLLPAQSQPRRTRNRHPGDRGRRSTIPARSSTTPSNRSAKNSTPPASPSAAGEAAKRSCGRHSTPAAKTPVPSTNSATPPPRTCGRASCR